MDRKTRRRIERWLLDHTSDAESSGVFELAEEMGEDRHDVEEVLGDLIADGEIMRAEPQSDLATRDYVERIEMSLRADLQNDRGMCLGELAKLRADNVHIDRRLRDCEDVLRNVQAVLRARQ